MKRFGKYRLEERIAIGGTAEVFKAAVVWGDDSEEQVVLKKILPQHAQDATFRKLFHEEALLLASLKHPNVVALRDFGEMQGTLYLALEHVDGADLDVLLRKAREVGADISPPLAAWLAVEICSALECIHTRTSSDGTPLRIVHRDISPHNILVSTAGEVKLADFGIAKSAIRDGKTTEGTIKGKFDYLSPEQASPGDAVDARTDLFALGVVLYEMLLGEPPFRGRTDVETLDRVRQGSYSLPQDRLPPPLYAAIQRCLEVDPAQRPRSAAELKTDIQSYLAGIDPPVDHEALGRWVARVTDAERPPGAIDGLVRDLFGRRSGETAIVASPTAEHAAVAETPARRRALPTAALLAVAVAATAVVTLTLSRYLGNPAAVITPDSRPPEADQAHDMLAPRPPDTRPAPDSPGAIDAATQPWLEIRSTPPGARVTIDGKPAGSTPALFPAPSRPFRIALTRSGYQTWHRTLTAPPRDGRIEATLARLRATAHGRLTINSIPWAHVHLDGRRIGTTPIRAMRVTAGRHRVVLKGGGGQVLQSFVTVVRPGDTTVHSFDRKRSR